MSNPYGERDERSTRYVATESTVGTSRAVGGEEEHTLSPVDGLDGYGDNERAMELMGITPTTFSNNIQFQIPRFLQDGFDPAVLHQSASVPTSSYSLPPSTTQPSSNSGRNLQDSTMDFAGNGPAYSASYMNASTTSSDPYATFSFPSQSMFPQLSVTSGHYSAINNSPTGILDGSISGSHPPQPPKPPRSSTLALNGLPIYSASGFDMLDILARVATRPQPKIQLGPVDMTCAFLVVDVTRDDSPIIYVSHTFTELTGYSESEILGQNCRFLQAPPGVTLEKGGSRAHTDMDSVTLMAQNCSQNRECQVTLVNYKKSGEAFINCVSIVPIVPGGNEPVRYQVGFQVDLALQPLAIMRSVQNGSYITNYSSTPLPPILYQPTKLNVRALSKDMSDIMNRMSPAPAANTGAPNEAQDRQKLSMALLEECPDAIFVVSLKGSFLYVSPSVTRLLQYDADFFLNKNLADICHPSDLAPTMRNVKESSANAASNPSAAATSGQDIELLFRARRSDNTYIWLDCPGKLHADTSRGRKALLLRLREIEMPRMVWSAINTSGGVSRDDCYLRVARDDRGLVVACLKGVEEVLGRKRDEVIGKTLADMVVDDADGTKREAIKGGLRVGDAACGELPDSKAPRVVFCNIPTPASAKSKSANGSRQNSMMEDAPRMLLATTEVTFFPPLVMKPGGAENLAADGREVASAAASWRMKPQTVVVRIRVLQRQAMGGNGRDSMARGSHYAPGSSNQAVHVPGAGYYGLPPGEVSYSGMPASSLQQLPSPVGRRNIRKAGYQVQLSGNVNVIDDSTSTNDRPSLLTLATQSSDAGASSGSSGPPADGSGLAMVGSSWQYELQQLRMKNDKLRSELTSVKKEHRTKHRESNARRPPRAKYDSHAPAPSSIPTSVSMNWGGGGFATPTGPSRSTSYPGMAPMLPPPPPNPNPHGYDSHDTGDSHKRTWSQTDMHSEWNQWGH